MADLDAAPAAHHQIVDQPWIDAGRAPGVRLPVLEGDAEVQPRMPPAPGIDDGVVGHQRVLRRVEPDPRIAGVANQVVADHPTHGLVPAGIHLGIQVLRAGVEADQDAGNAGVLDPVALDQHVGGTALEVQAGGGDVVDVAVFHHHARAVDVVDAVGVHRVDRRARRIGGPGVADLDGADRHVVRLGRDLDAVAPGVADQQVLKHDVGGPVFARGAALVPVGLHHHAVDPAAAELERADAAARGCGIHLYDHGFWRRDVAVDVRAL